MANTVRRAGAFVTLSAIDTDFVTADLWPEQAAAGIPMMSITFVPTAITDKCTIREGSATGPVIFQIDVDIAAQATWDSRPYQQTFGGLPIRPCLNVAGGSYSAGARIIFHIGTG
jgi:hypothetical protein